uniref:Putative neurotoxin LTDF 03-06 n=1 Tax=Dolomedes fimbriatus TaxID=1432569 RepID=A0A0K1D8B0_9ARAC|nr:putative neurotoxin LTDF 03-06 [Dolomedes fimbriatus]
MKILFVFITVLYVVHSFSQEEEDEAIELHEEIALRDAEPPQAEVAVREEARSCKNAGEKCESDCDCCGDRGVCSCTLGLFFCSCGDGAVRHCVWKQEHCAIKPKQCWDPSSPPGQRLNKG